MATSFVDCALNSSWSEPGAGGTGPSSGKAAGRPGTFYFWHLIYTDVTDYPAAVEIGLPRAEFAARGAIR